MTYTQTVTINSRFGEQYEGAYEFRQITQGEYERILIGYMDALGKVPKQDILKVNREMLWLSLHSQPAHKPLTKEAIVQGRLPYGLSIQLQTAYDKVNGLEAEEQRFLSSPCDASSPIPDSPNSSSANASDGQSSSTCEPAAKPSPNSPSS
jgi:hypothetical protein